MLVLLLLTVGCRKKPLPTFSPVIVSFSPVAATEAASREQAWIDARSADPLELSRLAARVSADELAAIGQNDASAPEDRLTAVRALAFSDDPTPAFDSLCALALGRSELSQLALQSLVQIFDRPRRSVEAADPGAYRRLADSLALALPTMKSNLKRDLSLRILQGLSEIGAIDKVRLQALLLAPTP